MADPPDKPEFPLPAERTQINVRMWPKKLRGTSWMEDWLSNDGQARELYEATVELHQQFMSDLPPWMAEDGHVQQGMWDAAMAHVRSQFYGSRSARHKHGPDGEQGQKLAIMSTFMAEKALSIKEKSVNLALKLRQMREDEEKAKPAYGHEVFE